MAQIILQRVTELKEPLKFKVEDQPFVKHTVSEDGMTLTATIDFDNAMQAAKLAGEDIGPTDLSSLIRYWRSANKLWASQVVLNDNLYYTSKKYYWRLEY